MAIKIAGDIYSIIHQIIDLIKDNDSSSEVRQACVGLLVTFLDQGKTPKLSGFILLTTMIGVANSFFYSDGHLNPVFRDLIKETERIYNEAAVSGNYRFF